MNSIKENWATFKAAVEISVGGLAMIGTGIWAFAVAAAERDYQAVGGEALLTVGAGILAGVITHKIFKKVEDKRYERYAAACEARRLEEFRRANKARMFTIEEKHRYREQFRTFTVGE